MRTILGIVGIVVLFSLYTLSCKKNASKEEANIPPTVEEKVAALGFSTYNIKKVNDGYIVEEDIFLSASDLDAAYQSLTLTIATAEQYRTSKCSAASLFVSSSVVSVVSVVNHCLCRLQRKT